MNYIGQHHDRKVYWLDYENFQPDQLPDKDWVCLAFSNAEPNILAFEQFAHTCIKRGILEFKGQGIFGEKLHNLFDETIVVRKVIQKHRDITAHTTWHTDQTPADTFWECFYATRLPQVSDRNDIKIVCIDLDGVNRRDELKNYMVKFSDGWSPPAMAKASNAK